MPVKKKRKRKFYSYQDFVSVVEIGSRSGIHKYMKYAENNMLDTEEQIEAMCDQITNYVMLDLGELIDWRGE